MTFQLVRATENDLPFIMATERREGYDAVVGRWDEARHREAFADAGHVYFVGIEGSSPIGFVILRGWAFCRTRDTGQAHSRRRAGTGPGQNAAGGSD